MFFKPPEPVTTEQINEACRKVGQFMLHWSLLEREMNASIRQIFRLHDSEGDILVANIGFRDKVNIIRSSIEQHSKTKNEEWRKAADNVLVEILALGTDYRNVIAHNSFFPEPDGAVVFYRSIARKKLDYHALRISPLKFLDLFASALRLQRELKRILEQLQPQGNDRLVAALLGMPTIGKAAPDLSSLLKSRPQETPSSEPPPATTETNPEIGSTPPQKEGEQ